MLALELVSKRIFRTFPKKDHYCSTSKVQIDTVNHMFLIIFLINHNAFKICELHNIFQKLCNLNESKLLDFYINYF